MAKKYVKYVFSIILIFEMFISSFVSYATDIEPVYVSRDDFNKVFEDFNSRLSIFEAGINSKIDSQVTSYLERHGIWTGKSQVLVNEGHYEWRFAKTLDVGVTTKTSYTHDNNNTTDFKAYKQQVFNNALDVPNGSTIKKIEISKVIEDIDKAGLLNLVGSFYDDNTIGLALIRTTDNYADSGCFNLKILLKIQKNGREVENTMWTNEWIWENNSNEAYYSNSNAVSVMFPKQSLSTYFFVAKGDKITLETEAQMLVNNSSVLFSDADTDKLRVEIREAKVY